MKLKETSKRMAKDKKKANSMIIPSASKQEQIINQYETVKYTINVNDSGDFFNKKDFFPQELRSYIELLNKLFKRQNDIITSSPGSHSVHKRKPIELPVISEYNDLQKTTLNFPDVETTRKEEVILKYLTHGVRSQTAPVGAQKNYIVAMAGTKKKKGGTKKGKKGKGGDEESDDDDDGPEKSKKGKKKKKGDKTKQEDDREMVKKSQTAVMTYQLSDLTNLKNGISAVPTDTYTKKIISFRAEPSKPEISCFRSRPMEEIYYYNTNLLAGLISTEGIGYIMYPNRDIAIEITRGRIGKKVVVYTESKTDKLGNYFEPVPVAIFDDFGNGAVYDSHGKIRLNYDQGEGVLYDTPSRLPLYWKWNTSQFLIQRRQELRYVDEDEPDNVVEDEEEAAESQEKTPEEEKGQKKKKKKGTAKKKSKKGKRGSSESESEDEDDEDEKSKKGKKKGGTKKKRRKSEKDDGKKSRKKSGRKSEKDLQDGPKEGRKSKKKGRTSGRLSKRVSTLSAKARLGKLKAMMDFKGEKKRVIPPVSKPPSKELIPITDLKPLAVKITDHISLRIMSQGHIHIDFACNKFHLTLNLGMTVYPEILERIDKITLDPNDKRRVPCYFEFLHKRTFSLIELNSKRNQMLDRGKQEKYKKLIKQAYTMGTYIYLRKKKLTSKEQIDSLAHRNADQLKVIVD